MKIFVMSDIHGSSFFLKKAIEAFEKEKAEHILLLGDLLYHGPRNPLSEEYNPREVSDILDSYKDKIIGAVRGNCDSEVDQMMLAFPMMNDYSTIFLDGKKIFATHGHLYSVDNLPMLNKGDVFIQGHTHIPLAEKKDDVYVLNPGSVTLPKGGSENSYGLFENNIFYVKNLDGKIIKKIELGTTK